MGTRRGLLLSLLTAGSQGEGKKIDSSGDKLVVLGMLWPRPTGHQAPAGHASAHVSSWGHLGMKGLEATQPKRNC